MEEGVHAHVRLGPDPHIDEAARHHVAQRRQGGAKAAGLALALLKHGLDGQHAGEVRQEGPQRGGETAGGVDEVAERYGPARHLRRTTYFFLSLPTQLYF